MRCNKKTLDPRLQSKGCSHGLWAEVFQTEETVRTKPLGAWNAGRLARGSSDRGGMECRGGWDARRSSRDTGERGGKAGHQGLVGHYQHFGFYFE